MMHIGVTNITLGFHQYVEIRIVIFVKIDRRTGFNERQTHGNMSDVGFKFKRA